MRISLTALAIAAGSACAQPPTVTYQISFTSQPHNWTGPLLYYADYVRMVVNASFSPPVGTAIMYTSAAGVRTGTIAGLGTASFDLLGCDMAGGTWTLSGTGFNGTTGANWGLRSPWNGFGAPGMAQSNGDILNISPGQPPFGTPNSANPVNEIWRARWDYANFSSGRWQRLTIYPRDATIMVRYAPDGSGGWLYDWVPAAANTAPVEIFMDSGPPAPCTPTVYDQPQSLTVLSNGAATFHVSGQWWNPQGSCGNFTYAWRRGCQALANGGSISGADTDTLRIDPVTFADAGQYDVRLNGNQSYAAALTVLCYANCDASTAPPVLNVNDFGCFLNAFAAGDSYANCDRSTSAPILNVLDFSCFLNQFAAGCP